MKQNKIAHGDSKQTYTWSFILDNSQPRFTDGNNLALTAASTSASKEKQLELSTFEQIIYYFDSLY